jgi:hypothetical protein
MMKKRKSKINITLILLIILLAFTVGTPFLVYTDMKKQIQVIHIDENAIENDKTLIFSIDEQASQYGYLKIRGWRLRRKNAMDNDFKVALFNRTSNRLVVMPTCLEARPDVSEKYKNDNVDYSSAGFFANLQSSYLKRNKPYELVFVLDGDKYYYTGVNITR